MMGDIVDVKAALTEGLTELHLPTVRRIYEEAARLAERECECGNGAGSSACGDTRESPNGPFRYPSGTNEANAHRSGQRGVLRNSIWQIPAIADFHH